MALERPTPAQIPWYCTIDQVWNFLTQMTASHTYITFRGFTFTAEIFKEQLLSLFSRQTAH